MPATLNEHTSIRHHCNITKLYGDSSRTSSMGTSNMGLVAGELCWKEASTDVAIACFFGR